MFRIFTLTYKFIKAVWLAVNESREFLWLLIFLVSMTFSGTLFYMGIEGWSMVDALYFVIVNLSTVGYGDVAPQTDAGKLFTIVLILTGVGTMVTFVSIVARHAVESQVDSVFGIRKLIAKYVNLGIGNGGSKKKRKKRKFF